MPHINTKTVRIPIGNLMLVILLKILQYKAKIESLTATMTPV